jgi:hypothetical protein
VVKRKTPAPTRFNILVDGKSVEWPGFESTPALGIVADKGSFSSVMLMSGATLAKGFASLDLAHAFNLAVAADKKLNPGTPDLKEFYARAGGLAAAKALVEKIKKRVTQEQTK